ncbi:DegT/DnrJ/EryC1/StrS family aminotransferase [Thalassospira sp. MA62]|nr:DegT/DnrJ/EryC1/StrS family aminotransferase [Thalassospira sp. MA62]
MTKPIKFVDLTVKYAPFLEGFQKDLAQIVCDGNYILGDPVSEFEKDIANFIGVKHAIAVANGTDALVLGLKACGVKAGDEVITTPMSYLASTSAIALCGATAVFADVDESLNLTEASLGCCLTERTKAILPVHLAGNPADMEKLKSLADKFQLAILEDCAQAFGASIAGRMVGSFGDVAAISFHPLKNLGALGDAGAILTNNDEFAHWLRRARNHGHISRDDCGFWSLNSRLDTLQAAFLRRMFLRYPSELERRRELACEYKRSLDDCVSLQVPVQDAIPSYNWFVLLADRRDELMLFLSSLGIETKVHYPILIPDMAAAAQYCARGSDIPMARNYVRKILSLPCGEHITNKDARYISECIKNFYR